MAHPRDRSEKFLGVNSTTREKGIRGIKKGKGRKESGHMVAVTGVSEVEL